MSLTIVNLDIWHDGYRGLHKRVQGSPKKSWKFILNPSSISQALDVVQERASKKRILLKNAHCSLVLAVFIQGRVLTIRIIYRNACSFHTLSAH